MLDSERPLNEIANTVIQSEVESKTCKPASARVMAPIQH